MTLWFVRSFLTAYKRELYYRDSPDVTLWCLPGGLSLFDPLDNFALVLLVDFQLFTRFVRCQEVALKRGLDR